MPLDKAAAAQLDEMISAGEDVVPEGSDPETTPSSASSEKEATNEAIAEAIAKLEGKGKTAAKPAPKPKAKEPEPEPEEEPEAEEEEEPTEEEPAAEEEPEAEEEPAEEEEQEEEEPDTKADLDYSERFNKLAQQEKKMLREREESKRLVAESEGKLKSLQDKHSQLESAIALLEINPLRALKMLGKDFQKMATRVVDLSKNPALALEDELRATREEVDRKLDAERKRMEEERKTETAKIAEQKREIDRQETIRFVVDRIDEAAEEFELIKARGMEEQVAQDIWDHFQKTGEVVKYHDYLTYVEKKLEEEADKLFSTKKLAGKYRRAEAEPEEEVEPEPEPEPAPAPRPKAKTLSNRVNSRAAPAKAAKKTRRETTGDAEMDEALRKYID